MEAYAVYASAKGTRTPRAIWKDTVLGESDHTRIVGGNYCCPADSLNMLYLRDSPAHTTCGWKGEASYCDIVVNGDVNEQAAWFYAEPQAAATYIKNPVAFWRGVTVVRAARP